MNVKQHREHDTTDVINTVSRQKDTSLFSRSDTFKQKVKFISNLISIARTMIPCISIISACFNMQCCVTKPKLGKDHSQITISSMVEYFFKYSILNTFSILKCIW